MALIIAPALDLKLRCGIETIKEVRDYGWDYVLE